MNKSKVLNIIKEVDTKLAEDMKDERFIGWIVLCVYITEKGSMRNLEVVINEFCDKCYELMKNADDLQNKEYKEAVEKVTNDKDSISPCKLTLKIIKKYEQFYNMLPKWFDNQDLDSGFFGYDGNFERGE